MPPLFTMNLPEPKPPDPHFHAFLLPMLSFSCSLLLSLEYAQDAALGWSRKSGLFLTHPHNPCITASAADPAPAVAAAVRAAPSSSIFLTAATSGFTLARLFHGRFVIGSLPKGCSLSLSFGPQKSTPTMLFFRITYGCLAALIGTQLIY